MTRIVLALVVYSITFATPCAFFPHWNATLVMAQACPNGVCPNR
ncbi:putative membrane protein (plasmid) [Rhizobium favelukesii]|uniref:Membrane protein n=1 Tax=Rhizobium favelukesii TaxID=348824 RepID=W6RKZ4_9HYPH|nr:putative membrane protein [Rhizobium favelukesii]